MLKLWKNKWFWLDSYVAHRNFAGKRQIAPAWLRSWICYRFDLSIGVPKEIAKGDVDQWKKLQR